MALLSSLLSITWIVLAAPEATLTPTPTASAEQDIRVVLFISAPTGLQKSLVRQVAIPIGQDIELVPMDEFQVASRAAHLRHAGILKSAVALAHTLRLSHVVTIAAVQPNHQATHKRGRHRGHKRRGKREKAAGKSDAESEDRTFLEVFVGRLRPKREILSVQRYYLPNRQLTESTARVIVERVKAQLQTPVKLAPSAPGAASTPPAGAVASSPKHPPIDKDDLDPLTQDVMAEQEAEADAVAVQVAVNANHLVYARGSVAAAVTQRTARLKAGVSGQSPPCYCGGAFANTFVGAHLSGEIYFRHGLPGLGAQTDLTLYVPHTDVQTDGQARTITSVVTDFRIGVAYQWRSEIGLQLTPRVGWGLFDFPLSDGDFPGLSYSYPYFGFDFALIFGADKWQLHAGIDYLATLSTGEDAMRLGTKTSGNGIQATAGASVDLGPVELGLNFVFTTHSLGFSGQTFLFTEQTFDNVSLSDQQLQLLLSVGTRFW